MMDDHEIREADEMVESEYIVERRRGVTAHVPHDDSI